MHTLRYMIFVALLLMAKPCSAEADGPSDNLALHRKAWASTSVDRSLTAQLATDGRVSEDAPQWLEVRTNSGAVPRYAREWTIDGGRYSEWPLMGPQSFIEYILHDGLLSADSLHITGRLAYRDSLPQTFSVQILASVDGRRWHVLASEQCDTLPGKALRWRLHSDPNKQTDNDLLPARNLDIRLPLPKGTQTEHLRIAFDVPSAAYIMLWDVDGMAFHYDDPTAWMSAGGRDEWLAVDLSRACIINKVRLQWLEPPAKGMLQGSVDGQTWSELAPLKSRKRLQEYTIDATARYLRLRLDQSNRSGHFVLAEFEAFGEGGTTFQPAPREGLKDGRYSLNGGEWSLYRADDAAHKIPATVPATVLKSYENIGAIPNILLGDSLLHVSEAYFNAPFTYETHFSLPKDFAREHVFLCFDGINHKADVWMNGQQIDRIEGAFIRSKKDVTALLKPDDNVLRISVYPPAHPGNPHEKTAETTGTNGGRLGADSPTFLATVGWDWIPTIPGREVGIWNDVYLSTTGAVSLSDPMVETRLERDTLATITPRVFVRNHTELPQRATVHGWVADIGFQQEVDLLPNEEREVVFRPEEHPQLRQTGLALWWPNGYGAPTQHSSEFKVHVADQPSDSIRFLAGLREITHRDADTQLKLFVNGQRVVPLGGNWGFSEANLAYGEREYDAAVAYHRHMHFNMIRNWVGQTAHKAFYEACDRHGIMVWQDFWLANPADGPDPLDEQMFLRNAADYVRRIRRHASLALFCGRNEGEPPAHLNEKLCPLLTSPFRGGTAEPSTLNSAPSTLNSELSTLNYLYLPSSADGGVSGHGPYQPLPAEEYFKRQTGKLHTERGMPAVMNHESLRRMFGEAPAWPQNDLWGQHDFTRKGAQGATSFNQMVADALGREPSSAEEYCRVAQLINYNGYRAMYEAARTDGQGLLIWMSHPCWPTQVWQTYDYFFDPTAAYFGAQKGCEPLHIQWNALTRGVQVVNSTGHDCAKLWATAARYTAQGELIDSLSREIDVPDGALTTAFTLEKEPETEGSYYLVLQLVDGQQALQSSNIYLLSTRDGVHADLMQQPERKPQVEWTLLGGDGERLEGVARLINPWNEPLPMVRLMLTDGSGERILPVVYEDNFFTLMPAEERTVRVSWRREDAGQGGAELKVGTLQSAP